jgi:hypothetical protein
MLLKQVRCRVIQEQGARICCVFLMIVGLVLICVYVCVSDEGDLHAAPIACHFDPAQQLLERFDLYLLLVD